MMGMDEGRGKTRLVFLPTGRFIVMEWWHSGDTMLIDENVPPAADVTKSAHVRLISSCVQTLWCVGKSLRRVMREVGFSQVAGVSLVRCRRVRILSHFSGPSPVLVAS